ncbi:MAG: OmpA family protein [Bacteroidota bacterium]
MKKSIFILTAMMISAGVFCQGKSFRFTDEKFEVGAMRLFDDIYYCTSCGKVDHMHCYTAFDSYCGERSDASSKAMDSLIAFLWAHPEVSIEISNHTDVRGSFTYNMKLSNYKLISLTTRIRQSGVDAGQVSFMAYGESNPVIDEKTIKKLPKAEREKAYRSNERTFIRIVSVDNKFNESYVTPKFADETKTTSIFSDADSVIVLDKFTYVFYEEKLVNAIRYDKNGNYDRLIDFKNKVREYAVCLRKGEVWLNVNLMTETFSLPVNLSAIKKPQVDVSVHELKPHIEFDFR